MKPYTFVEFPKWVTPPGGVPCIVRSSTEEAALMAATAPDQPAQTEKDTLRREADALGIEVDGRWSVDRLKSAIAAAQVAPKGSAT